jgi:soluble lytic murein transglycosylase
VTAIGQRLGLRTDYYGLRAYHVAHGVEPFQAEQPMTLPQETAVLQTEAETWLREQLALDPGTEIAALDPILQNDPRLQIGTKLWHIGRLEDAKAELEQLRREAASSALYSYQLALYFREIGLYRSSIIAANSVLVNLRTSVFNAPRFLGQLAYPIYYADVIMPLAEKYGYDPRLQFALVRQESLFESFARSGAAAQGLSQVIPDTGAYIARRLAWPEFENADLYKPYVGLNFGAFYLAEQLGQFDEFVAAALAAYNAGPGNAAFWLDKSGPDHDLFVETVTFSETRLYVERIYLGYFIYAFLYGA